MRRVSAMHESTNCCQKKKRGHPLIVGNARLGQTSPLSLDKAALHVSTHPARHMSTLGTKTSLRV